MGKILRGARIIDTSYRVGVPEYGGHAPDEPFDEVEADDASDGFAAQFDAKGEAEAPSVDAIDWEALRIGANEAIERAGADARCILEGAFRRAAALLESARREREAIAAASREEGLLAGREAGLAQVDVELTGVVASFHEFLNAVRAEREAFLRTAEPELVRLAIGAAERVVHHEIAENKDFVIETVRHALSRALSRSGITVRVHPDDIAVMREYRDRLLAAGDFEHLRLIEDQRVDRGGAILESDSGTIDAKVSTQLREVRNALVLGDERPDIAATAG